MSLVVPFDGSELAEAALERAETFGSAFDEPVVAVTVIPKDNAAYARNHGWIAPGEAFDGNAVIAELREQVAAVSPDATFRYEVVDKYATAGTISQRIRRVAHTEDASMVLIGSDNVGRLVASVSSVGRSVAADSSYDVLIVRRRSHRAAD